MTTKLFYTWKRLVEQLKMGACIHKTRKIRFSLNIPTVKKVLWVGNSGGCMLVVPEASEMPGHIAHCQRGFPQF